MGRLDNNANLLNALHNNTPFVYAHLVKFEKPITSTRSVASNDNITYREAATDFVYLTDGAFDIVFDDGSKDSQGNAHGAQTYAANKLLNVGSLSDSSELKVAGTSIVLDSSSVDATVTDSIEPVLVGDLVEFRASKVSFSEAGFREGDTIEIESGANSNLSFRINNFKTEGKTISCTLTSQISIVQTGKGVGVSSTGFTFDIANTDIAVGDRLTGPGVSGTVTVASVNPGNGGVVLSSSITLSSTFQEYIFVRNAVAENPASRTINLISSEISSILHSTGTDRKYFVNRRVVIYKAFFFANNTHTFIGTPVRLFSGIITSAKLDEDLDKSTVTWSLSNFLGTYNKVIGRLTSDEQHRLLKSDGSPSPVHTLRPEYAGDLGFVHAENSISVLASYSDQEMYFKKKKTKINFGPFQVGNVYTEEPAYRPTTREVDLRFDFSAKHIPVIYGVQKVKPIPVFADVSKTNPSEVFAAHVLCEGPIQSVLNIYVNNNSYVAIDDDDEKMRSLNDGATTPLTLTSGLTQTDAQREAAATAPLNTIGNAARGTAPVGNNVTPGSYTQTLVVDTGPGGKVAINLDMEITPDLATLLNLPDSMIGSMTLGQATGGDLSAIGVTALAASTAGELGIIHRKTDTIESPNVHFQVMAGLRDQQASDLLVTQSQVNGYMLQDVLDTTKEEYWGSAHRLLDTAYVATRTTINPDESSIPDLEYLVRGKLISCFNYDNSYLHSGLSGYASEDHANFNEGDLVNIKAQVAFTATKVKLDSSGNLVLIGDGVGSGESSFSVTATNTLISNARIIDKFYYYDSNGLKNYRYRWDLTTAQKTLLSEAKRFYMESGSNQWHMLTYDTQDVGDLPLDQTITIAEVFVADLTQTTSGSSTFEATLSNITATNTALFTLTNAKIVLFTEIGDDKKEYSNLGTGGMSTVSEIYTANIVNITGGMKVVIPGMQSNTTIPSGTKMMICNEIILSDNAQGTDDYYNDHIISVARAYSSSSDVVLAAGYGGAYSIYTIVDYDGSSKKVTLNLQAIHGALEAGREVSILTTTIGDMARDARDGLQSLFADFGDVRPSNNFALITLDYLRSQRYGPNVSLTDIDLDSFLLAAQECDAQSDVTIKTTGNAGDFNATTTSTPLNNDILVTLTAANSNIRIGQSVLHSSLPADGSVTVANISGAIILLSSPVNLLGSQQLTFTESAIGDRVQLTTAYWAGTISKIVNVQSGGSTTRYYTFTDVAGKLIHRHNPIRSRKIGELVYDPDEVYGIRKITSNGLQSNASSISDPAVVAERTLNNITTNTNNLVIPETNGSPIVEPSGETGYSLYDSDDVTYWRWLGWEEPRQRYVTRHQGNITIDTASPVLENLKGLLQHFNASLYNVQGKFFLKVETARAIDGSESDSNFNDDSSNTVDIKTRYITDDDIIGSISLKDGGLQKVSNSVNASIPEPKLHFADRSVAFFDSNYKSEDAGIVKTANFTVPGITNYFNARLMAKQILDRTRLSREISFVMRPSGLQILPGDLIRVYYPRFGWGSGKEVLFRVRSVSIQKDCLVGITATEYSDSIYLISKNIKSRFFKESEVRSFARTPSAPTGVNVTTGGNSAPNIVRWTKAAGIADVNAGYEIWRATSESGDATIPVTTHATLLTETAIGPNETSYPDDDVDNPNAAQNFIYWIRAYNIFSPSTSSGSVGAPRKYYGPFNTDSDLGGVGAAYAAQAKLIALEQSLNIDLTVDNVSIPATQAGVVSDFSNTAGTVKVFLGTTEISVGTSFTIGSITTSNAGITTSLTGANYAVTAFPNGIDAGHIDIPVTVLANATTGFQTPVTRTARMLLSKAKGGPQGQTGKSAELSASKYVINYNEDGVTESDTITFTATAREFASTAFFTFFVDGSEKQAVAAGSGTPPTKTFVLADSDEPGPGGQKTIRVDARDGSSSGTIIASDSISIYGVQDGSPAVTGFLTNEAHSVNTSFLGTGATLSGATGTFKVFVGGSDVTTSCSFQVLAGEVGINTAISNTTGTKGVYTTSNLTADIGIASFKATVPAATAKTVNPVEIIKVFTVTKSRNAAPEVKAELSNPASTVAADSNGTVSSSTLNSVGGVFEVRKDGVLVNSDTNVTFAIQGSVSSGLNVSIDSNTGVYVINSFTADQGQATFRATIPAATAGLNNILTIDKIYNISRAPEGTDALIVSITNNPKSLLTTTAGVVDYTDSGIDITAFEGSTQLNYDDSGSPADSTFRIGTPTATSITAGAASTVSSNIRRFANASSISADTAIISFPVTLKRSTGVEETRSAIQHFIKAKQGQTGLTGASQNIIFQRSASQPSTPSASTGVPTSSPTWYDSAEDATGTGVLWASSGVKSPGTTVFNWTAPVQIEGSSVAEIYIYRKNNSTAPSGGSYNFTNNTISAPSGWSTSPITLSADLDKVYVSVGLASGSKTDTAASFAWSTPAVYAERQDGQDVNIVFQRNANKPSSPSDYAGVPSGWNDSPPSGTVTLWAVKGLRTPPSPDFVFGDVYQAEGEAVAEVYIYRLNSNAGASGGSYNFTTNVLTPPANWSTSPPAITADGDQVYVAVGLFQGAPTATAATTTYSTPVVYAERTDGSDGAAVNLIFQRSANQPSTPSNSSGVPSGWYDDPANATGTTPLWASKGNKALGASVYVFGQPYQVEGEAVVEIYAYRKNAAGTPSGGSFNFVTSTLTTPSGWSSSPPAISANNDVIYVSVGLATGSPTTTTASISWSAGVIFAQRVDGTDGTDGVDGTDGDNGAAGVRSANGRLFYQIASTSAPGTPSASGFNFSTQVFSSRSSNWGHSPPTYASGNTNKYWYSTYAVTEATFGGTQSVTIGSPIQAIGFSGLVTFSDANTITDGTNSKEPIEGSQVNANVTSISGGAITTGSITSTNHSGTGDGSAFSTAGTKFNLNNGTLSSPKFRIASNGSVAIDGAITAQSLSLASGVTIGYADVSGGPPSDATNDDVANTKTTAAAAASAANTAAKTSGSIGGISITGSKLYQGTGTFNNANTGFYLDSSGNFSLKNKLSFNGSTLSIDGAITAQSLSLGSGVTIGYADVSGGPPSDATNDDVANSKVGAADLGINGTTVIHGGRITTGTLVATQISGDISTFVPFVNATDIAFDSDNNNNNQIAQFTLPANSGGLSHRPLILFQVTLRVDFGNMSLGAQIDGRTFIVTIRRGSSTSSPIIFNQRQAPQARDQHTLTIPVLKIDSATTSSQTYTITLSGSEAEEDGTVLNTEGVVIGMR